MRQLVRILVFLIAASVLLIVGLSGFVGYKAHHFLNTPPEIPGQEVVLHIEPGSTFDQVARQLQDQRLIANADYFRLLGQWKGNLGSIQAGEFVLRTDWQPEMVLDTLVSGSPLLHRLCIREGLTWWQTAKELEDAGFADAEVFDQAVSDPELLARHGIPFDIAEGFLFPDTYLLQKPRVKDGRRIMDIMLENFWKQTAELWPDGRPSPEELRRVVILASLVEKETGAAEERSRIAGVFANRLERRMRLQTDVSVIYGLGREFDGNLTKAQLEDESNPYNTYPHGLWAPTPICSPGLEALKAAQHPEEHRFLYFVSRQDGSHAFSRNLEEHNENVRVFQLKR